MKGNISTEEILVALKLTMKKQGITYAELGRRISVSEQTIKRMFREKECSLSRLIKICDAIDISLTQVVAFCDENLDEFYEFTDEQSLFLSEHPNHYRFMMLLYFGESVRDIQKTYHLDDRDVFYYLRDLDAHNFLELGANNQIRLLFRWPFRMRSHSPFHQEVKRYNTEFIHYVTDNDGKNNAHVESLFRFMSEDTLKDMQNEMRELNKKYRKIAQRENLVLGKEKLLPITWAVASAPYQPNAEKIIPPYKCK